MIVHLFRRLPLVFGAGGIVLFLALGVRSWDPSGVSLVPVAGVVISALLVLAEFRDRVSARWRDRYSWALFGVYEAGVLVMGLRPKGRLELPEPGSGEFLTLGAGGSYDVLMNVIGFIPLGFLLAVAIATNDRARDGLRRFALAVLVGGFTSLAIEVAQYFIVNRSSSLVDVATNVLGTAVGAAYAVASARMWEHYASRLR